MKQLLIMLALVCMALPSYAEGAQSRFFETLYDVPVMPGMVELPEKALVFDKPSGRVAQAGAASESVPEEAIRRFYAETLPQLGWAPSGQNSYTREGEKLVVSVGYAEGYRVVDFTLSPIR